MRISFDDPEAPSPLVAELYRWWYRARGMPANRLLVDSFIIMDPWWTLCLGAAVVDEVQHRGLGAALERHLDKAGPYDEIHLMLFAHGVDSIGLAPIERWRGLLARARRHGRFVGVDEEAFPADFAVFARYHPALRQIPGRHPLPAPLSWAQFEAFVRETGADRQTADRCAAEPDAADVELGCRCTVTRGALRTAERITKEHQRCLEFRLR